jgi:hypothetical protein
MSTNSEGIRREKMGRLKKYPCSCVKITISDSVKLKKG